MRGIRGRQPDGARQRPTVPGTTLHRRRRIWGSHRRAVATHRCRYGRVVSRARSSFGRVVRSAARHQTSSRSRRYRSPPGSFVGRHGGEYPPPRRRGTGTATAGRRDNHPKRRRRGDARSSPSSDGGRERRCAPSRPPLNGGGFRDHDLRVAVWTVSVYIRDGRRHRRCQQTTRPRNPLIPTPMCGVHPQSEPAGCSCVTHLAKRWRPGDGSARRFPSRGVPARSRWRSLVPTAGSTSPALPPVARLGLEPQHCDPALAVMAGCTTCGGSGPVRCAIS